MEDRVRDARNAVRLAQRMVASVPAGTSDADFVVASLLAACIICVHRGVSVVKITATLAAMWGAAEEIVAAVKQKEKPGASKAN